MCASSILYSNEEEMCASSILYSMAGGQTLSSAVPGTSLPVVQGSQKGAALLLDPALAPCTVVSTSAVVRVVEGPAAVNRCATVMTSAAV